MNVLSSAGSIFSPAASPRMNSVSARSFSAAVICGALGGGAFCATDWVQFSAARTAGIHSADDYRQRRRDDYQRLPNPLFAQRRRGHAYY
jgi:hypothetical protein